MTKSKNARIYLGLATVMLGLVLLYPVFAGGWSVHANNEVNETVYVDRITGKAFMIRATHSPEFNPDTGEQTLFPGMYCEQCGAWKSVGPVEMLQTGRLSRNCPIHKTPLLFDGPVPE